MILLLDLGNSRIKWGLAENGEFRSFGAVETVEALPAEWAGHPQPARAMACSVQSVEMASAVTTLVWETWQLELEWLVPTAELMGVRNHYQDPASLGADRWAALLGARARFADEALIVVSAGTALVVDALTADGDYLGGMILPGYRLMKASLAKGTARLPLVQGRFVPFPVSTADAIETGCLSALTGAISAMLLRLETFGQKNTHIVISGGDAAMLAPLLAGEVSMLDNLVLQGLLAYGMRGVNFPQG